MSDPFNLKESTLGERIRTFMNTLTEKQRQDYLDIEHEIIASVVDEYSEN